MRLRPSSRGEVLPRMLLMGEGIAGQFFIETMNFGNGDGTDGECLAYCSTDERALLSPYDSGTEDPVWRLHG